MSKNHVFYFVILLLSIVYVVSLAMLASVNEQLAERGCTVYHMHKQPQVVECRE